MKKISTKASIYFLIAVIAIIIVINIFAPLIAPYDPTATQMTLRNELPSSVHWFGTDGLGRDVLSRVIYGGRGSLFISFFATCLSMLIGIFIGGLAGWYDNWVDHSLQVLMSLFQSLPGLSISIAVVGVLGPSNYSILIALTLTGWSGVARIVRSQVREIKHKQYIESARTYLPSVFYLLFHHVLSALWPTLAVLTAQRMGRMMLSISALSFIGVGLQPPTPDWGVMIQDAKTYVIQQPWALIAPAVMICIAAFCLTRLGERLRDYRDAQMRTMENM
ncbi:MAG: ABC transporter permease [Fastidiosipilaceae bacterium]|jgi:peptide/nickel transport system permease protein|nr:ABC transporter permease [Clostridiaceae bacterium]